MDYILEDILIKQMKENFEALIDSADEFDNNCDDEDFEFLESEK